MGFNWRDQDEQDLDLGNDYSEQRLKAAQRERQNGSTPRRPNVARKPKIITLTVQRLRRWGETFAEGDETRERLLKWADELDAYDARETRLDPSKRKRKQKATR